MLLFDFANVGKFPQIFWKFLEIFRKKNGGTKSTNFENSFLKMQ